MQAYATASAFAPGRVELLGNHTDYNEGLVLGATIDRGLTMRGGGRDDGVIHISSGLMGDIELSGDDLHPQKDATWANYPLGIAHELARLGIPVGGFDATVEGNLAPGSGLSSSAAFEVATALFLLKLRQRHLEPMELARLCHRAEHGFVGVKSGLLDQVMSVFGRRDHLILFDARSEEVRLIAFPENLALIIAQSGKQRELSKGDYNLRREQTKAAAMSLGVRSLRDISPADLNDRANIDPLLKRRAAHIVGENERVERAITLLGQDDAEGFGRLLNESHQSSQQNFENSTVELDLLVQLARRIPGVLGARLTGGGFGGAIVALCRRPEADAAVRRLHALYERKTRINAEMYVCRIGDGAR